MAELLLPDSASSVDVAAARAAGLDAASFPLLSELLVRESQSIPQPPRFQVHRFPPTKSRAFTF